MGWYFRKSFNAGPFRLNLSRSGLGASFGVRGARIGTGPRGSYIRLGAGGLYYQQSLGAGALSPRVPGPPSPTAPQSGMRPIATTDAAALVDASSVAILRELNRVHQRFQLFLPALIGTLIGIAIAAWAGAPWWVFVLILLPAIPGMLYARHLDVTHGTAILRYDLDPQAQQAFGRFVTAFNRFGTCGAIWHVQAVGAVDDWKRNAGASTRVDRTTSRPAATQPPRVNCNIQVPTIRAGRSTLYFFPDRVLVYQKQNIGAVPYSDVQAAPAQTRFIEEGHVPHDASVVDHTWRYVNKSGGPDRRFNGNRQIPVCLYEEVHLRSALGLNELFQCSRRNACYELAAAIASYATSVGPHPTQKLHSP
jgi:hypothetical protein